MAKSTAATAEDLLGTSSNLLTVTEDSLAEEVKTVKREVVVDDKDIIDSTEKIDFSPVMNRVKMGEKFYIAKNTGGTIVHNWNLPLLTADLREECREYALSRYKNLGIAMPSEKLMYSIYTEGRTLNMIESFCLEKGIPSVVPITIGKEIVSVSRFIFKAGETILLTETQVEALEKYRKRRTKITDAKGERFTSWEGFLIFSELETEADLSEVKRSFVTTEDIMKTGVRLIDNVSSARIKTQLGDVEFATE